MKVKQIATGSVCPAYFGGATEAKQSWQGYTGVKCCRVWGSFAFPALLLLLHASLHLLVLQVDQTLFPPLRSQVRQACVLLGAQRVLLWKFSLLPPPVFWAVLLQEVRQGWASGAC